MCYAVLTMASKPPIASSLNPNAPVFIPASFLAADDFSPEWWRLIQTSTSFREWWMKERFEGEENEEAAYAREQSESEEIAELLELGFQPGVLEGREDVEEPTPVPHAVPYQLPPPPPQPYTHNRPHQLQNGGSYLQGKPQ